MKFAITGVTRSGNMGGAAMLLAAMQELSARHPGARFVLLSVLPDQDKPLLDPAIEVVAARPIPLLCLYLPLSIILWPLVRARSRMLAGIPYFRALFEADVVIDLCGIAFVDGRGLPLLAYNVACCLPAIAAGVPVAKLSQALGPFQSLANRTAGRWVLSRCRIVVARGAASLQHLRDLGIKAVMLPDTTFALDAGAALPSTGDRPLLVACPSEVVNRLCASAGISFEKEFADFLKAQITDGWRVLIVAHSLGRQGKNNDVSICQAICARLPSEHATMLTATEDPLRLRAVIGSADAFVGCRFHAVASALAMAVPSLVVGWSHKYREMVEMLQPGDWGMDYRDFSAAAVARRFNDLARDRSSIRAQIRERLPAVQDGARRNFVLATEACS